MRSCCQACAKVEATRDSTTAKTTPTRHHPSPRAHPEALELCNHTTDTALAFDSESVRILLHPKLHSDGDPGHPDPHVIHPEHVSKANWLAGTRTSATSHSTGDFGYGMGSQRLHREKQSPPPSLRRSPWETTRKCCNAWAVLRVLWGSPGGLAGILARLWGALRYFCRNPCEAPGDPWQTLPPPTGT